MRIKLSELCYKSIACDVTEDKKHIDLSAEPMILVCAAGLRGSNADDVAKEVAIYRAHKAAPIVIADDDETPLRARRSRRSRCPPCTPTLAFVLCALAGHLFGYEAALAIDASARPLREARAASRPIVAAAAAEATIRSVARAASSSRSPTRFFDGCCARRRTTVRSKPATAVRLASLLRYATGVVPLDAYQIEFGKVGTPSTVVEDLTAALTKAIEELTRPVDAIKHQAKTVTVGISRSDETLLQVPLVQRGARGRRRRATASPTARCARWSRSTPRSTTVVGWTRYRIEGDPSRRRRDDPRGRPRRHRARHPVAHRRQPGAARYQAPRRDRARGHGRPRAAPTAAR